MNKKQIEQAEKEQAEDCKKLARNLPLPKQDKPSFWRWLRSLLPVLMLVLICTIAKADTWVVDMWGTVISHWNWPESREIWVVVPGPSMPPPGWPNRPQSTPAPATPRYNPPPAPQPPPPSATPKPA